MFAGNYKLIWLENSPVGKMLDIEFRNIQAISEILIMKTKLPFTPVILLLIFADNALPADSQTISIYVQEEFLK
ncbi:MAG: hypothetical protein ACFE0I_19055 [Elainellaceae cyanobacterium]